MSVLTSNIDGLVSLPKHAPERAAVVNHLLTLLTGLRCEEGEVPLRSSARLCHRASGSWLACEGGWALQLATVSGKTAVVHPQRVEQLLCNLDAIDPALDAIEAQLGMPIEPLSFSEAAAPGEVAFAIDWLDDDAQIVHSFALAVEIDQLDAAAIERQALASPGYAAAQPCLVDGSIVIAHLDLDTAADLGAGDLVLITAQCAAKLGWQNGGAHGIYDCRSGDARMIHGEGGHMDSDQAKGGFEVPVTIALPQRSFSAETLSKLRPGSTLALGPLTAGLGVELAVGGRKIARGELVQIGDQFAVLIEDRDDMVEQPDEKSGDA